MISKILCAAALCLSVVGCKPVYTQNATFQISGAVKSFSNAPSVVAADQNFALCVDVSYQTLSKGNQVDAQVETYCDTLVTDQNAKYTVTKNVQFKERGIDAVKIMSAKVYARKTLYSQSSTVYYIYPVVVTSLDLNDHGGTVQADVIIY